MTFKNKKKKVCSRYTFFWSRKTVLIKIAGIPNLLLKRNGAHVSELSSNRLNEVSYDKDTRNAFFCEIFSIFSSGKFRNNIRLWKDDTQFETEKDYCSQNRDFWNGQIHRQICRDQKVSTDDATHCKNESSDKRRENEKAKTLPRHRFWFIIIFTSLI